jgi:hypothetical protein
MDIINYKKNIVMQDNLEELELILPKLKINHFLKDEKYLS